MPTPPIARDRAERGIEVIEQLYREGYVPSGRGGGKSAIQKAGEIGAQEGWLAAPSSIHSFLRSIKSAYGLEPDESHYNLPRYQQPVAKLHLVHGVPLDREIVEPSGDIRRHLFIPDEHNDPRHSHRLRVQKWIARYGSEHRHHVVIKAGDSGTFDSCSTHDKADTARARANPPIRDDLDNHEESLNYFEMGRDKDWKPIKKKARGNHEQRIFEYENRNPASLGTHSLTYEQQLAQFGWRERPFGEIFYVDGIGYTHCPMNGVGRPMTGVTAPNRTGHMLTTPLVYGHTHKFQVLTAAKMGEVDRIAVIEGGCCLPWGEVENYAMHSPTGWSYGIVDLTVQGGQVLDYAFVSIPTLRRRYSDDGADVRAA